jgi:signal transduction histidine kinase
MLLPEIAKVGQSPQPFTAVLDNRDALLAGRKEYELLALLGHELRNPLTAMLNALQLLDRCGDDHANRKLAMAVLKRQMHRLDALIEDMLDFSRIRHGKVRLEKRWVALAGVVSVAIETVRPAIDARGHALEIVLPTEPVTLEADATRLEQVLINLLANAARYTPPGGQISLTVQSSADQVVLRVKDNGVGISREALPYVFDPYWQASWTGGQTQGGLGLGLSLVRHLVEMHDGSVTANSAGPGQGSEFVVRLPRCQAPFDRGGDFWEQP